MVCRMNNFLSHRYVIAAGILHGERSPLGQWQKVEVVVLFFLSVCYRTNSLNKRDNIP